MKIVFSIIILIIPIIYSKLNMKKTESKLKTEMVIIIYTGFYKSDEL